MIEIWAQLQVEKLAKAVYIRTHTLHGTAIYAYIDTPGTTPGLIGSPMAVPWSIWVSMSVCLQVQTGS